MKKNLYINDVNVTDYGFYINSDTYLDAPLIDYSDFSVPARNGSVILYNKRFNNVIRKFDCYIDCNKDVVDVLDNLKKLLYSNIGYLKIRSDYEPEFYQYGYLAQEIKVKPFNLGMVAKFELYFSCMPEKYSLLMDENSINVSTIYSKTIISNVNYNTSLQLLLNNLNNATLPKNDLYFIQTERYIDDLTSISFTSDDYPDLYIIVALVTRTTYEYDDYEVVEFLAYDKISNLSNVSVSQQYALDDYDLLVATPFLYETFDFNCVMGYITKNYKIDSGSLTEIQNITAIGSNNTIKSTIGFYRSGQQTTNLELFAVINNTIVRVDFISMLNDGVSQILYDEFSYENPQGPQFIRLADMYINLYRCSMMCKLGDKEIDLTKYLYYVGDTNNFNSDKLNIYFTKKIGGGQQWITVIENKQYLESEWWKV